MLTAKKGRFLISAPSMVDNNFFRSVILLAVHNTKESVGFVLNQPTKIKAHQLLTQFPKSDFPIYIGGPVERNSLHYIHTCGKAIDESQKITENLYWGGDFDQIKNMIADKQLNNTQIRFFVGYSGWGENQLSSELKQHAWIVAPPNEKICMELYSNMELWSKFIKKMDQEFSIWANLPKDPTMN